MQYIIVLAIYYIHNHQIQLHPLNKQRHFKITLFFRPLSTYIREIVQAGFTKGGNILDNLFIIRECVEETYRKKEQMVAIAIDFKKAYDSIKRETMVQILKELRIDSKIIDFIVRIYKEDSTMIQLEKKKRN